MSEVQNNSQEKRDNEEGGEKEGSNAEANDGKTVSDNANNEEEAPGEKLPPINTNTEIIIDLENNN